MENQVAVNLLERRRKQQRRNRRRHKLRLNMKLKLKNQQDSVLNINELLFTEFIQIKTIKKGNAIYGNGK